MLKTSNKLLRKSKSTLQPKQRLAPQSRRHQSSHPQSAIHFSTSSTSTSSIGTHVSPLLTRKRSIHSQSTIKHHKSTPIQLNSSVTTHTSPSLNPSHLHTSVFHNSKRSNYTLSSQPNDDTAVFPAPHSLSDLQFATRGTTILLAGFNSFFANHLYLPLLDLGVNVIPVTREARPSDSRVRVLTIQQIKEQGLPEVDFVINCSASNIFSEPFTDAAKITIEESRLGMSSFWSDAIRKTHIKPRAFLQMSSSFYYPDSELREYTEEYVLPAPPLESESTRPELQAQELSLPYWSRLHRNLEYRARVFRPETDISTAAEYEKYLLAEQNRVMPTSTSDSLGNDGVRVINFRTGHLLAQHMQEHQIMQPFLDNGLLSHIGTGTTTHPWIHVDDAVNLAIHSLFDTRINGPVNAVAPTFANNKEIFNYIIKAKQAFKHNFGIKPATVDRHMGLLTGSLLYSSRKIIPQRALDTGFQFQYPTIQDAIAKGTRSKLDEIALDAGGFEYLPRNLSRNLQK